MPGNSGNKSNKPKLHGSTNSLRDTFNQALNEATTAEQARSKANSGEGHSAKSSNTNFAELKEWYDKLDYDTRSAMDKAADKPTSRFTNEERDNFYLKVDPYHYLQYLQYRYPGKTEFIQSRMHSYYGFRRHLEENGVAPKKPSETKPETQYAEQAVKEQANKEESPKDKSIFDIVQDETKAENSKSASQPTANPEKIVPEKQAAKDMVDNSINNSRSKNETGDAPIPWYNQSWRDIVNNTRDKNTPSPIPPNRLTGDAYPIVKPNERSSAPYRDFNWRENTDNLPFYNKNAVNRHIPDATHAPEFYLNPVEPLAAPYEYGPIVTRKAAEKAYEQKLDRKIAVENAIKDGLWGLGILGATAGTFYGLDKLGKYIRQDDSDEQPQTQVPYRMEPEPVNEAVVQPEPTPEQQFVLQSTSPFDYAKIANLFDLYNRYGSPNSPIKIDPVKDKELIDEAMSDFESPQNPPDVGTNINDANLVIPDADEAPEEINDAMLDAKPGSFWKATRDVVSPKVNAVKNAAQNVFGRTLARSKTAPKASNGSASNIQDTSNGPVVLNTPRQRKTNSRVNYQDAAKQMLGASESVNNLAREAYNFNKQQSSQKPEAALAQSLLRAQQESRANRGDTGLQQYRYQSLLNSGLRGMTPDEAIRSGLLTPEQVQVLMRGPY